MPHVLLDTIHVLLAAARHRFGAKMDDRNTPILAVLGHQWGHGMTWGTLEQCSTLKDATVRDWSSFFSDALSIFSRHLEDFHSSSESPHARDLGLRLGSAGPPCGWTLGLHKLT